MNFEQLDEKIDIWLDDYRPVKYGDKIFGVEVDHYDFYVIEDDHNPDRLIIQAVQK